MSEDRPVIDANIERFVTDLLVANKKNIKGEELKRIYGADINKKGPGAVTWNIDNFIAYCQQSVPNFKWQNVYLQFDRPNLEFQSEESFLNLMKFLEKVRRQAGNKFKIPEQIFFRKWNNPYSQAKFLI